MTNRDKYIIKRNECDMMFQIIEGCQQDHPCAVKMISGKIDFDDCIRHAFDCKACVREWLNREAT